MSKKVALVLSGCGFLDGAEIRESVLSLLALSEQGAEVSIFAPDTNQHHTINHSKGEESGDIRNILVESARIARGEIKSLEHCHSKDFDALIFPGGFGVAKNLCSFAFEGSAGSINPEVERVSREFKKDAKPIGAICITPALMALLFGSEGVELSIGNDADTATEMEKTGCKHINTTVEEFHTDEKHKIVSTAAYMYGDASLAAINKGISGCIKKVLELA